MSLPLIALVDLWAVSFGQIADGGILSAQNAVIRSFCHSSGGGFCPPEGLGPGRVMCAVSALLQVQQRGRC